jgi:GntR family transcriptional regulator/MocR family aminotransferase
MEASMAIVTPGHQSPLSVSLTLPGRQALLGWASEADAWILEDDYDSEFHYAGRKPPALKRHRPARAGFLRLQLQQNAVPGLRLGYLLVPVRWMDATAAACELSGRGHSALDQAAVAAFMADGHYARHLRRMRLHYARRSSVSLVALEEDMAVGTS